MCQALHFVVGADALSFGWDEPYEAIAGRHELLRRLPPEDLGQARAVPPDGDCDAPSLAWDIVVDHAPADTSPEEVARRCRQAFAAIRPVLHFLMREGVA